MNYPLRQYSPLLAAAILAAIHPALQANPNLGVAQGFAVLGGSTVTNTGGTVINGNLGVSPGTAITGFPPGTVVNGSTYTGTDAIAVQAHTDTVTAYNSLANESATNILTGQNLGGLTLTPGIYRFANTAQLSGTLTLDPLGDPNAKFHFQIGSTLTTANAASIVVLGGLTISDIFWQVGSSAILGSNTDFQGSILAQTSITLQTGADIVIGRALAINGAVTLDTNSVSNVIPAGPAVVPGIVVPPSAGPTIIPNPVIISGNSNSVEVNNAAGLTVSGAIGGTIGLTKTGSGLLILTAAETYTGPTTILGGVLQIGNGNVAGAAITSPDPITISGSGSVLALNLKSGEAFDNNVNNNAVLTAIQPGQLVISGDIGGSGAFVQAGSGRTILTGNNTYAGPTLVGAGTLQVGDGTIVRAQIAPNSAVVVSPGANLVLDLANNKTFANNVVNNGLVTNIAPGTNIVSGVISGPGGFQQNGAGITILTGSLGGNALLSQGTLAGNGNIAGNVTNNASIRPIGRLTIGGNYAQGSNGNFLTTLDGNGNNLSVAGQSQLNGTLQVSYGEGFAPLRGDEFTILTSANGVSGQFNKINNLNEGNTLLTLDVVYLPNSVLLRFVQGSFQSVPDLTENQNAVAVALDRLSAQSSNSKLIASLDTLSINQLANAYDALSGEQNTAIFESGFASIRQQSGIIERRLEDVRDNSSSQQTQKSTESQKTTTSDDKDGKNMISFDGKESKTVSQPEVSEWTPARRWGFYLNGGAQVVDIDGDANASGSDFTNSTASVGADYRLTEHTVIGATAGYINSQIDGANDSKITNNGARGSLYATWFDRGLYVNALVGGGYDSYDTKRNTLGGNARGNTDGSDYTALIGTGYEFRTGRLIYGPIAALQYTTVSIDGFTETGSLAPLQFDDQSENSLQSRLGARASYAFTLGRVVIVPEVRAQWQHEFQDDRRGISSSFAENPKSSYTVYGPEIGRDSLLLDIGASAQLNSRTAVYAYYTGDLGAKNYSSHSVNVGVRINF